MKLRLSFIALLTISTSLFGQNTPIAFENHVITEYHNGGILYEDLDGDSDLDLLSTDGDKVVWYENVDGQGHFSNFHIINNYGHWLIEAVDLDSDGDLDIFAAGAYITQNHPTNWYENDGKGNFTGHTLSASDLHSYEMKDLNGDGDLDIITSINNGSFGDEIVWFKNNGQGGFGTPQTIGAARADEISSADMDGDGDLDIVGASDFSNIFWFENLGGQNGFDNLKTIEYFNVSMEYFSLHDLDVDGDKDVVWQTQYTVYWSENLGLGSFGSKQLIDHIDSWRHFSIIDLDGDGDEDILTTNSSSPNTQADSIGWFENNGQGNFGGYQSLINISYRVSIVVSMDIDGDGDFDILTKERLAPSSLGSAHWYEHMGGSTFGSRKFIDTNSLFSSAFNLGDIEGDGDGDLLFSAGYAVACLENLDGLGDFGEPQLMKMELQDPKACMGDLDGDGDLDILSSPSSAGTLAWFENLNSGFFVPKKIIASNMTSTQKGFVDIQDLDGDGDMDAIAVIQDSFNNNKIIWYENMGQGNFGNTQHLAGFSADQVLAIYFSDLDGDGDLDLISASVNDKVVWYENNGQGSFGAEKTIPTNASANQVVSIYTSDLDGDGDQDLLSTSKSDSASGDITAWCQNDGQGNFGSEQAIAVLTPDPSFPFPSDPKVVAARDLDGDGDMDVVSTMGNKIVWNENTNGQGSFGSSQTLNPNNSPSIYAVKDMYVADVDNDNDMDVISSADGLIFHKNDGQGNFGTTQVLDITAPTSVFADDINGDGNTDVFAVESEFYHKLVWYGNLGVLDNKITGNIRLDSNADGCTSTDVPVPNIMVTTDNGTNTFSTFTLADGSYQLNTNPGNFTTTLNSSFSNYFSVSPNSYSSSFTGLGNTDTGDFCVTASSSINDLNIAVYPLTDARPGFDAKYQLVYRNMGATVLNGTVELTYDGSKLTFLAASETVSSQTTNTLSFDYANLNPFETRAINVDFNVAAPPTTNIDDILQFTAVANPVASDHTQNDNTFVFNQTVIGSYDPNDIQVLEGDKISKSQTDEYLHYIIRFQNTGTASAVNIRVANELGPNLDWGTLQLENMSHSGRVEIKDGNQVEFIFDGIYLPDSNSNEPASHGFVQYKIKPKDNIAIGQTMFNDAEIFFDFNPPIQTNTVSTTVVDDASVAENTLQRLFLYPNPTNGTLNIHGNVTVTDVRVFNHLGQELIEVQGKKGIEAIDLQNISPGIYFVKLMDAQGNSFVRKVVKN